MEICLKISTKINRRLFTWTLSNLIDSSELCCQKFIDPSEKPFPFLAHFLLWDQIWLHIDQIRFIEGDNIGQLVLTVDQFGL